MEAAEDAAEATLGGRPERDGAGQPGASGVKAEERATSLTTLATHVSHMSEKMAVELPRETAQAYGNIVHHT